MLILCMLILYSIIDNENEIRRERAKPIKLFLPLPPEISAIIEFNGTPGIPSNDSPFRNLPRCWAKS